MRQADHRPASETRWRFAADQLSRGLQPLSAAPSPRVASPSLAKHKPRRRDHLFARPRPRAQIPIAIAAPPPLDLPRVPSLQGSGRRPWRPSASSVKAGIRNPQQELTPQPRPARDREWTGAGGDVMGITDLRVFCDPAPVIRPPPRYSFKRRPGGSDAHRGRPLRNSPLSSARC